MTSWLNEEIAYLQAIHLLVQSPAQDGSRPKWKQKVRKPAWLVIDAFQAFRGEFSYYRLSTWRRRNECNVQHL